MKTFSLPCFLLAATAAGAVELLPLPSPDLSAMDGAARQRIEAIQAAVQEISQEQPREPKRLSLAFGELGKHYLGNELLDASSIAFKNARMLAPEDHRWSYYLGVIHQSQGELDDAIESLEQTLELKSGDLASLVRLGDVLMELGRTDDAEARYRQVLELAPEAAAAHYGLANVATARDDHAAAVKRFEKALSLQPEASIVHYPLGQAYRKLGNLDKAREHLKQRGEEPVRFPDPLGSEVAWLNIAMALAVVEGMATAGDDFSERDYLGFVLAQLGDVTGAIEQLEEALQLKAAQQPPADSEAAAKERLVRARLHYVIGGLLVNQRSDEEARGHFESAFELAPELEDARIKLGNIEAREGLFDQAVAVYSEVLTRNPESTPALLKRAAARMSQDREDLAISDLKQLLEIEPEHSEARLRLARALEGTGDADAARAQYEAALELELPIGEKALTHYHLGELARKTGDPEGAIARYQSAIDLDPQLVDARFQLATTLGRLRRFEDSAARYRELIELEPQHTQARLGEATALSLAGRFADAYDRLNSGLMAIPGSLELTHTLARLLASSPDRDLRDGERAVELAEEAVAAAPSLVHAETLAMALAEAGRFEDAATLQRGLIEQAEAKGENRALPRLRRHLLLYQGYQACCGD